MSDENWYIVEGGEPVGPIDKAAIRMRVRDRQIGRATLVWQEGMSAWTRACDVPGLLPPPIPPEVVPTPWSSKQGDSLEVSSESARTGELYPDALGECLPQDILHARRHDIETGVPIGGVKAYAGFWKRFAALLIDYLVMLALLVALAFLLGSLLGLLSGRAPNRYEQRDWESTLNCASVLLLWLYFAGMESSRHQATLGKLALGIKVTDATGCRIGFGRASGRHFAKIISGLLIGIGYIIAAFTPKKQALHDILAGCLVVNR